MSVLDKVLEKANQLPAQSPEDEPMLHNDVKAIEEVISMKEKELRLLQSMRDTIPCDDPVKLQKIFDRFATCNESGYLAGKKITWLQQHDILPSQDYYTAYGKPETFPASLTLADKGHYVFHLPPLSGKSLAKKTVHDGKAIHCLITYLLHEYEKEHEQVSIMERPIILIEHCIAKDGLSHAPDPDNVDVKSILDSLQNYFLKNDSVLDLVLIQSGRPAEYDHTKVHVISRTANTDPAEDQI